MRSVKQLSESGKRIFFCDLRQASEEEFLHMLDSLRSQLVNQTRPYATVFDITDTIITTDISQRSRDLANFTAKQGLTRGTATIGITGIKRVIARVVKPNMYWANDLDDAKRWLLEGDRWK